MRNFRAYEALAALALPLLAPGSCGQPVNGIAVLVHVNNVPAEAQRIFVRFKEDGNATRESTPFIVTQDLSRFVVGITDPQIKKLDIAIDARGLDGCIIASGTTAVELKAGTNSLEASIDAVPDSGCVVDVQVKGKGVVKTSSMQCTSSCTFRFNRGESVTLNGALGLESSNGTWSGDCTGDVSASCTVTVDRGRSVTVDFTSRSCSEDGVCAFPLGPGVKVQSVTSSGDYTAYAAGDNLYTNQGNSQLNFTVAQTDLGSNTPLLVSQGGQYVVVPSGAAMRNGSATAYALVSPPAGFGTILGIHGAYVVSDLGKVGHIQATSGGSGSPITRSINVDYAGTVPLYGMNSSGFMLAVGAQGALITTSTVGTSTTWVQRPSGTSKTLRGVSALTSTTSPVVSGFAVGDGGVIVKYQSGGWSVQTEGDGTTLNAVVMVSANQAWAAGDNGVIKSWDGTSWTNLRLPQGSGAPKFTSVSTYTGVQKELRRGVFFAGGDTIYALSY